MRNVLTIDVEDWFQVSNLDEHISRDRWAECEFRLRESLDRVLDLLQEHRVSATFFVLGWNAWKCPDLVRDITGQGHEVATHGFWHRLVYDLIPGEFRDDLRRSIDAIGEAGGVRVRGHRAPSFSVTPRSLWALEVMAGEGLEYDSSMFPVRHDRYGVPQSWSECREVHTTNGNLTEIPITTWRAAGVSLPFSGGGYFRLLPYCITKRAARSLNRSGKRIVFYFHPWELDPGIPRFHLGAVRSFRCYHNIRSNHSKLAALLHDFDFGPILEAGQHSRSDSSCPETAKDTLSKLLVLGEREAILYSALEAEGPGPRSPEERWMLV